MTRLPSLLALLSPLLARLCEGSEGSAIVYVGSGGCDGTDPGCHDDPDAQKVIHAVALGASGELVPQPALTLPAGGMPVWFAARDSHCAFVTRPDKDDVLALILDAQGAAKAGPSSPSGGRNPVFASVTPDGRFLLVANYNGPDGTKVSTGSSVATMRIGDDCSLFLADSVPHSGSSVDPARQGAAHPHSFVPGGDGIAYACDLGLDIIFSYQVGPDGKLAELARTSTSPGLGPRHLVVHPTEPFIYVVCEMGQVVLTYRREAAGGLTLVSTLSLVPEGASKVGSKAAEIVMRADGSALYVTNRGLLNTVTTYLVGSDGMLSQAQQLPAPAFPRGMALALGDSVLLVAGQSKSVVAAYRVKPGGLLDPDATTSSQGLPPNPAAFLVLPAAGAGAVVL